MNTALQPAAAPEPAALVPAGWRQLWAAVLALAWFGGWGLLLQPAGSPAPATRVAKAPRVTYLPAPAVQGDGATRADLRVLWSPVLFSLPTPMGFSRSAASNEATLRPPLQQALSTPVLLARPVPPPAAPLIPPPVANLAGPAPAAPAVPAAPVFTAPPPATSAAWQVLLRGGLADAAWQAQPLPPAPADGTAADVEAGAQLEFSREGWAQHVWLDAPTASSNVNAQLVRALLQWRCAPAAAPRSGAVVLRATGPTLPPPPAPAGSAPAGGAP